MQEIHPDPLSILTNDEEAALYDEAIQSVDNMTPNYGFPKERAAEKAFATAVFALFRLKRARKMVEILKKQA